MFANLMTTIKTAVANMEFRATTAANMRRMIAATQAAEAARQQQLQTSGGEEALESTMAELEETPQEPAPEPPPARMAQQGAPQSQPKSVNDVFASMISQVGGRRVVAVPSRPMPPPGRSEIGRNDLCPCGSGKKYKKCCGRGQI